ncbi:MAG: YfhO family protein [Clostridiales bacterium]|nr:YfhO family protein [Clostridiales bacterium]
MTNITDFVTYFNFACVMMGGKTCRKGERRTNMSGSKTVKKDTPVKIGRGLRRPLLSGVVFFAFWIAFFILTDIYFYEFTRIGSSELTTLGIFRSRFSRADFSSYTFEAGMGMSIPRLLLSGFGGILSLPFSLLPVSVHPQALALLNAFRLALASAVFLHMISKLSDRSPVFCYITSFLYTAAAFGLCCLLRFPVTDTFFLFPGLILKVFSDRKDPSSGKKSAVEKSEKRRVSFSLMFLFCLIFVSSAAWDLLVIPAIVILCIVKHRKESDISPKKKKQAGPSVSPARSTAVSAALSLGLCAFFLLPQFLQMPYAIKGEPSASFLQKLGNDTDKYHTEVTYTTDATRVILNTKHSMIAVNAKNLQPSESSEGQIAEVSGTEPSSIFAFLNDWFYSLWPSLPAMPFQDTYSEGPLFSDTKTASFTVSTLFSDPLFCAVKLPSLSHPVDLYVNNRIVSTITRSQETVLIDLGSYNVGQNLTITLLSSHAEDLKGVSASFGYMNTMNWNQFTENVTFGITDLVEDADGITADAMISFDSTLLTNIPYEKGWTLYANGEKHPVRAYRDAWISSDISAGHYIVHLHYTAPGSALGGWISGFTFFLLAVICFRSERSSKKRISSKKKDS